MPSEPQLGTQSSAVPTAFTAANATPIPAMVFGVDRAGRYTHASRAYCRWIGVAADSLIGRLLGDGLLTGSHLAADSQTAFLAHAEATLAGASRRFRLAQDDAARQRWIDVEFDPEPDGADGGFLATLHDVTEHVTATHGARQALAEYMYKVSHDLNEPLRMVASYCGLLERRYADALDEDARAFIGFAQDGAVRMQSLLSDLLQLSRVNTHRKPPAPVASGLCLRAAMTLLRDRIAETGAEVSCGDMPVVQADEAQLVEVFRQLLNNALKFRVESEAPRLRLSADSADGTWRFRIADNGIGVPPEQARRIFEVFQRLHGRDAYSGNGIGLTLCRAILERHGGFISMASEVGVGTSVHCDLPAERVFEVRGEERDLISSFRQIARSQGS